VTIDIVGIEERCNEQLRECIICTNDKPCGHCRGASERLGLIAIIRQADTMAGDLALYVSLALANRESDQTKLRAAFEDYWKVRHG
jgi:hypothetical protein